MCSIEKFEVSLKGSIATARAHSKALVIYEDLRAARSITFYFLRKINFLSSFSYVPPLCNILTWVSSRHQDTQTRRRRRRKRRRKSWSRKREIKTLSFAAVLWEQNFSPTFKIRQFFAYSKLIFAVSALSYKVKKMPLRNLIKKPKTRCDLNPWSL